ncbi:MAG: dihydrofolate reductase family protein, partial [Lactococcus lactis]|nr:dihydrofolate reductase family protein [Lactococcus lactis]
KTSYILTHQKISSTDNIVFIDKEKLTELSVNFADTDKNIWVVGGGEVIKLFLENHWVDELQVTIAPVLLGDGISLFPSGNYKEKLQLIDTKIYGQFVELHYLVKK